MKTLFSGLQPLSQTQSEHCFEQIVQGRVSDVELSDFLLALKHRGETSEEIAGAATALLKSAMPFEKPSYVFADCVGTGGDGHNTLNVSTAAALVVSAMGLPVAKHGNVSVSSRCGSADVLTFLGAKLDVSPEKSRALLDEMGFCFLLAPCYHPGMRFAMPVRRQLKTRTVFNLLGPLVNPAKPSIQLTGVYAPELCMPMAETLQRLGVTSALVVHGSGLDEIALHGTTTAVQLQDGKLTPLTLTPEEAGLRSYSIDAIKGDDPAYNARALEELLKGNGSEAYQSTVALNAAALFCLHHKELTLKQATVRALETINSGKAFLKLTQFVDGTRT